MSFARPFAFNTKTPIPGTIQVGNLAVGYPTLGFESTGLQWWNGPDEELGYVIAQPVPDNSQPTPVFGQTASVGFFRTNGFNDNEFVDIAKICKQNHIKIVEFGLNAQEGIGNVRIVKNILVNQKQNISFLINVDSYFINNHSLKIN